MRKKLIILLIIGFLQANDEILLEEKCTQGNRESCFSLAKLYKDGEIVHQDYNKAVKYYQVSCDLNHSHACNSLGYCYTFGQGVEEDYNKAFYFYQKSCNLGKEYGCLNLKKIKKTLDYIRALGIDTNSGVVMNSMILDATTGNKEAQFKFGEMLLEYNKTEEGKKWIAKSKI